MMLNSTLERNVCWLAKSLIIGASVVFGLCASAQVVVPEWPRVASSHWHFDFPVARKAEVKIHLLGIDRQPLYKLECHPGDYEDDPEFDYSGNFHCRLSALYGQDAYPNLLTSDPLQSRDWTNRGRVLAEELWGKCGDYPEYGRIRHFRLRGMKLTLRFGDVIFDRKQGRSGRAREEGVSLRTFTVEIQVEPNADALSMIAEPVPFAEPLFRSKVNPNELYRNCDTVVPSHVPGVIDEEYVRSAGLAPPYPEILPAEKTIAVGGNPNPTEFKFADSPIPADARVVYLPISDLNGNIAYEFQCSAYNVPIGEGRIDRYGIACGLFAAGKTVNLLGDTVDPYSRMSRAQILAAQLYGECAEYPEWGALREFRLRGFRLTMRFVNAVFTEGEFAEHALKQVDLNMKVEPDSTAAAPVALPSKYVDWTFLGRPNACENVFINPRTPEQITTIDTDRLK